MITKKEIPEWMLKFEKLKKSKVQEVHLENGIIVGGKYNGQKVEEVPYKYLLWASRLMMARPNLIEYVVSLQKANEITDVECIHCKMTKPKSEMVEGSESFYIQGLKHDSKVCQECFDRNMAKKQILEMLGKIIPNPSIDDVPVEFIDYKVLLLRFKRKLDKKLKEYETSKH